MGKTKKKPVPTKAKKPVDKKKAKPAKPAAKAVAAKPTKPAPKAASKGAEKAAEKSKAEKAKAVPPKAAKATEKVDKAAAKKEAKLSKEEQKKLAKAEKEAAKQAVAAKAKEKKKTKPEGEEGFEEIAPMESFGDAIRLTPEDLEDPDDVFLTDAEGRRYCKVKDCDQLSVVEGFCRYHYLALWKRIQTRKKILSDGKLEKYIEDLTSRYPDKYIEMIRRDLKTEKDFVSAIQELEIDDSGEAEFEEDNFSDDVRGLGGRPRGPEGEGGGDEF